MNTRNMCGDITLFLKHLLKNKNTTKVLNKQLRKIKKKLSKSNQVTSQFRVNIFSWSIFVQGLYES